MLYSKATKKGFIRIETNGEVATHELLDYMMHLYEELGNHRFVLLDPKDIPPGELAFRLVDKKTLCAS
jgi:hypothetical protein